MAKCGTVAIVGKPNTGKSTLLNRLVGEDVAITSPKPETTRDRIAGILTTSQCQIIFLDTPGIHRPAHLLGQAMVKRATGTLLEVDLVLVLLEATSGIDEDDRRLIRLIPESKPALCLINKIDKVRKELLLPLIEEVSRLHPFQEIIPISALKGDNVDVLLKEVVKRLPEGPMLYPEDELSDKSVRFLVAEAIRREVLTHTRQEVPHSVAVLIEDMTETAELATIHATIWVERQGQKGILIGRRGDMLKRIATCSRREARKILGKRVRLELWIKVRENWRRDPRALRELGYV